MAGFCFGMGFALCSFSCGTATAVRFLHLFKFGLVVLERCNASRRRAAVVKTPARFLFMGVAYLSKTTFDLLTQQPSTRARTKGFTSLGLLDCSASCASTKRAIVLPDYLRSFLSSLIGAFVLLLRSLVVLGGTLWIVCFWEVWEVNEFREFKEFICGTFSRFYCTCKKVCLIL